MTDGVPAREFHEATKHTLDQEWERPDPDNKPVDHKAYRDLPREPLPGRVAPPDVPALSALAGGDPPLDDAATRTGLDGVDLRTLLYYAAGVTQTTEYKDQPHRFRAASCTGALYHVDLYPVVGEDGPLPAGVYHFDPLSFSLDVLREGDFRGVLADASGDPRVASAPVTVVATSEWWRNAWKYTERTYRHAFWDSGTVLANLLSTAHAMDLPARVTMGFADEAVADLLGLDTADEAPLELVPVGAGSEAPDPPAVDPIAPETAPLSPDPRDHPLIHEAYVGSSLPDGEAAREWRTPPVEGTVGRRDPGDGERFEMDAVGDAAASKAPLHAAVDRRRSHREFAHEPLNRRKVATVLDRAVRPAPLDVLGEDRDRRLALNDCYLLVNAVEGVEPGAYHYHPAAGELERLHGDADRETAARLALGQEWGGDAALQVHFLTDLDAVVDRLGDRGYRAAQLEAALCLGRLYLATYAHRDLAGLGLTFLDDEITEFFSPRAAGQTPTCLYVLGRPE